MTQPHVDPTTVPEAPRDDVVEVLHGRSVADPYRWLEDAESEPTKRWSSAQADLYEQHLRTWPGVDQAASRIRRLMSAGLVGVPIWRGERCFQMRREPEQEHAVLLVSDPDEAGGRRERVLLDPMALDPSGLTTLDSWQPSKEGHLLAYQVSEGGTEESVLRVIDVVTGDLVDGPIDRARYSPVAFLPGGQAYYYVRRLPPEQLAEDERQFHRRIYLHRLGTEPATDVEIFGADRDIRSYYGVGVSLDGHWLTVSAATGTAPRNDLWIADLTSSAPESPALRPVTVGLDAQTHVRVGRDGRLYVATDLDAPRGRFAVTDPADPGPSTWQTLLAGSDEDGTVLEDASICDGDELDAPLLVAAWTRHAISEVTVHHLASGEQLDGARGRVELPGLGTIGGLVERPDGGPHLWFAYTDHTTPQHIHRYDARSGALELVATPPGALPDVDVTTRQVACTSADGTTVRMFVIAPRAAEDADDGAPRPTILSGYGGFGVSLTPGYSASVAAWVEAGGCYAVANLRGGAEEGEDWHRAGMLGQKHHVFEDFEAAAEHLIATGVTTPEQLCISGGSNGGLLVGAALTRRPELYRAVVCSAPLLDMIRYERFGLGVTWNVEYGSAEVAEEFGWLAAYSPYHQVRPGTAYPAVLFTVFDGDSRVDPLHARKMCAALQYATTSGLPVLIRAESDVGHGARALSRTVALAAETMAFSAAQTGLPLDPGRGEDPS